MLSFIKDESRVNYYYLNSNRSENILSLGRSENGLPSLILLSLDETDGRRTRTAMNPVTARARAPSLPPSPRSAEHAQLHVTQRPTPKRHLYPVKQRSNMLRSADFSPRRESRTLVTSSITRRRGPPHISDSFVVLSCVYFCCRNCVNHASRRVCTTKYRAPRKTGT